MFPFRKSPELSALPMTPDQIEILAETMANVPAAIDSMPEEAQRRINDAQSAVFETQQVAGTERIPSTPRNRKQALRILSVVADANRGWPELSKRNPELAKKFRDEQHAIARAYSHPAPSDMYLD